MKHSENALHSLQEKDKQINVNCVGEYNYLNIFVRPQGTNTKPHGTRNEAVLYVQSCTLIM